MNRWKITVEYDGGAYVGWQRQENGFSVQEALETAIAAFAGEQVVVHGAGRTDSGVHALAQVAHFDLTRDTNADTVRDALNYHLKSNSNAASIIDVSAAPEDFHARFSATQRHYLYRILNRRSPAALEHGRVWRVARPLNADAMDEAARMLTGKHDFSGFRAARCQADSPVKTLDMLRVSRIGEEVHVTARARSFLHNQVRILTGTLKMVGEGAWPVERPRAALDSRDRAKAGPTAPPAGLYLTKVIY